MLLINRLRSLFMQPGYFQNLTELEMILVLKKVNFKYKYEDSLK